ncbi:MAG: ACP S-malonyltransferase [Epsilonproteobacteria bacterium]|nr:ACP S-malonyltransferase [Campylobacterota bacterium]OIO14374.1 MAG: [acyl-carrier-protein] S-malonyltransferase [Helicobacteraceae bacterium CG1_02_36_14]PIP10750.1 MAG: [acyl-carrier-protein] S-malonyltransferase [Sulfurimonas sp. CG23_combo_of_CG06-09_8_20_14_all_36_33]PIS24211.1 MAG: [acyl-carrier-protein] S-malonyltransferase [Sulfurimonas sp. CG08_land_8_20_14_0_20_36_33]PIU36016.1 MAG: [acyl-carrier-protein] S-malonyltransferase [Sulfurimonas sp. CG07_land_8_20_14_0_80_36_56]PIV04361
MSKKIAMIFSGQGSQAVGMGQDFYDNSELAREMFEKASERIGVDFKALIFEDNEQLAQTAFTQPAILLVQMIAYRLFKEACPQSKATLFLGHSLGEFSALCASGAIDFEDAIELVHKRGSFMQSACESIEAGMMAIVGLDDVGVEKVCSDAQEQGKKVWPANYNQDGQLVVAGMKSDLISLEQTFKDAGAKRALLLNMSVASHCDLLAPAQAPLEEMMQLMIKNNFEAPIISNVTTKPYSNKEDAVSLLKEQLIKPVKYKQSIEAIASDVDLAIEFGNGTVLKGLNRRIAGNLSTLNVSDMASLAKVVEEVCI